MRKSDIQAGVESVRASAATLADRAEAAISDLADEVKARVDDLANRASPAVEQAYGEARRKLRGATSMVATSVEDRPLVVLAAVGLICGALGFMIAGRKRWG